MPHIREKDFSTLPIDRYYHTFWRSLIPWSSPYIICWPPKEMFGPCPNVGKLFEYARVFWRKIRFPTRVFQNVRSRLFTLDRIEFFDPQRYFSLTPTFFLASECMITTITTSYHNSVQGTAHILSDIVLSAGFVFFLV